MRVGLGEAFKDDPIGEASARAVIGRVYAARHRVADAESELRRALELTNKHIGRETGEASDILEPLASMRYDAGEYAKAEELYRKVLAIREVVDGPEHSNTLVARSNLILAMEGRGALADAAREYRSLLEVERRVLGDSDTTTLATTHNLAGVLHNLGRYQEAAGVEEKVLHARLDLDPDTRDPDALGCMNLYARCLQSLKRFDDAEKWYRRCLVRRRDRFGADDQFTLNTQTNLAALLVEMKQLTEAETLARDACARRAARFGEDDPGLLLDRHTLAVALREEGKLVEALGIAADISIRAGKTQLDRTKLAVMEINHGRIFTGLKRFEEARTILVSCVEELEKTDVGRARLGEARAALFELFAAWGRPEEAEKYRDSK